ncbi:MAG: tryptophan-rich sensory protein [Nitrososphaerota archaeon]
MISINSSFLRFLNILTYALMIIVNGLAGGTTIIGGKTTAQISDANPTLITPAGYTFSIWGVIYILLGVFVLYQALPTQQSREYVDRIGYLFSISNSLNVLWIFLWQFEHSLSPS